ncbi:hypothetical protein Pla52n_38700 [Stieleria varia]|uniref:Uncharacterized protein n=1 Tax=Stieleria varia TaxID=2528005 RepID=A0A5C6ASY0_9BACT|nr:hypothetical protein Pla52n_38700 [Stieleria varia]
MRAVLRIICPVAEAQETHQLDRSATSRLRAFGLCLGGTIVFDFDSGCRWGIFDKIHYVVMVRKSDRIFNKIHYPKDKLPQTISPDYSSAGTR